MNRGRCLVVSWGRLKEGRCNCTYDYEPFQNWVDAELLKRDPAVHLGKRNTALRGWDDECLVAVLAP